MAVNYHWAIWVWGARVGVASDAWVEFTVGRFHREVEDSSLRHAFLHSHFRCGRVGGTDDEISVGVDRRHRAVREFLGRDIAGCIRIASRRGRAYRA